jgi:phosphoribosylanthranilate isomerase
VTPETAAGLSGRLRGGPPRVGLFVEPTLAAIADVLDIVKLDVLQIYGALDDLPTIRARFGLPVWRAAGIGSAADLPTSLFGADRLLLEAKPPAGADRPGGNATTFDWSMLRGWTAPAPWILAGGLTPDNVATAIRETGSGAVDVSSGVEVRKGLKDAALIRSFVAAAKRTGS